MPFRGGHGRTPGTTDPRQGKARGETYKAQLKSGLLVVLFILFFVPAVYVAGVLLFDPLLRPWGLSGLALVTAAAAVWKWRKRSTTKSINDSLTSLREEHPE